MTEQYDSDSEFETKIDSLVKLMRESKHCVIYTGAGISTAANIPDYRGKNGVWTSLEWSFYCHSKLSSQKLDFSIGGTTLDCIIWSLVDAH